MVFTTKKKKAQKEKTNSAEEQIISEEELQSIVLSQGLLEQKPMIRTIGLFGDVDEEKAGELIYGMIALKEAGKYEHEKTKKTLHEPFQFYLSTNGGSANDMFAIYDVMRQIRNECAIETVGLGKVMSAGVLLLAAGTRGKRKIGKNCRVMIHSVLAGQEGPLHNLENEMNEIRWTQERYIAALIAETKMSQSTINKLLQKHVNIYLSAEEAVKYGIADEVI
jgi:ATP-dependent Clp protease protease subunit